MGSPLTDVPFSRFFSESRLLKAGLIFNVGYYLAVVLTFVALRITGQIGSTIYQMDFQVFFAASQMLSVAPADLYSVASNGLPYRYLPAFAMVVQAFQWVPLDIAYLTWISLMMLANWANLKLAYHLCQLCGASLTTKNLEKTLFILFIAPQHVVNLILGQVSQLAIFLILYSLVILHSGADDSFRQFFVTSLLVGVAAHLKPFAILL
ncbi:MAG: glycosyltransferase 87 family protein, partial [Candidatus Thorarchaeota archaeon]